jgi:DNA ligase D-like protein (predicted 3'-phosphoesterase)
VAENAFAEWTQNGLLRQPRFEGLRADKDPRDCRRERPRDIQVDIGEAEAAMPTTTKAAAGAALAEYEAKRDFGATPEPAPAPVRPHKGPIFVVQEHHATRLHYDFRLEAGGVLKSGAVTNEPSLDASVKRLAVRVEDHPLAYATFSGTIPDGHYGAGKVSIWDKGTVEKPDPASSVAGGLDAGKLSFALRGGTLKGRFSLVRMRGKAKRENWLLTKGRDEHVKSDGVLKGPARRSVRLPSPRRSPRRGAHARAPEEVEVSNPGKVLYPDDGVTKADVAAYYGAVAPRLLPSLKDRPVTPERLPDGLGGASPTSGRRTPRGRTPTGSPAWSWRARRASRSRTSWSTACRRSCSW